MNEHERSDYINPNSLSNMRWITVGIRPGRLHQTSLQRLPLAIVDLSLLTIFVGDTITIAPEVRSKDYVLARTGVHIGWINIMDVKMIPMGMSNRQTMDETKPSISTKEREQILRRHYNDETEPSTPDHDRLPSVRNDKQIDSQQSKINIQPSHKTSEKLSHIKRLINYMKDAVTIPSR